MVGQSNDLSISPDHSEGWNMISKQLRDYAIMAKENKWPNTLILLDDKDCVYFEFVDAEYEKESIYHHSSRMDAKRWSWLSNRLSKIGINTKKSKCLRRR